MDAVIGGRDDREAFARARRSGFAGVEVGLRRSELRSGERVAALRAAARETGLAIPSVVLGEHNEGGLGADDPAVAAAAADDVRAAIGWAAELGADVVLVPFFLTGELVRPEQADRAGDALRELCPLAAERAVTLAYEGTLPADAVKRLAARVDSPAFGVYFDLANPVVRGMDTATEARALGPLIRRVHLKDTRVTGGDCPPGLGRVDFPSSRRALQEIGYDGWLVFETPPAPEPLVRRDLSFARTVLPLEGEVRWPRLGAFSYEFGDWGGLTAAFAAAGLECVQVGAPLLDECLRDPDRIAPLRDAGLAVAALAGYRNLVAPDPAARDENLAYLSRCLEAAPALGTSIVATETGTRHPHSDWTDVRENWSADAWKLLDESIAALLPAAERSGAVLALEAHVKNVLRTPGQLIGLLERFPSPHLQVVCDPYNYVSRHLIPAQERVVRDLLDRFEHRFVLAHLKDVVVEEDGTTSTPEFGTGVFEQRPYLEFLRRRRPDLPLILEHLPFEHVPAAAARVASFGA
jgi:sugar phosphate isomerase/epimerase